MMGRKISIPKFAISGFLLTVIGYICHGYIEIEAQYLLVLTIIVLSGSVILGFFFYPSHSLTIGDKSCGEVNEQRLETLEHLKLCKSVHYVLVEDDFLVRAGWQTMAEEKGYDLRVFSSAEDMLGSVSALARDTVIFSDSDLGDGMKGEDLCRELHQMGFSELYLQTGFSGEAFSNVPFIKGLVTKTPPF